MKKLMRRITTDLEVSDISAIYNSELARVWPTTIPAKERAKRIRRFAKDHGFDVNVYEVGLCAIFQKSRQKKSKVRKTQRR